MAEKEKKKKTGLLCSAECWITVSEAWWHSLFERLQRVLGVEEMKINKLHNEKEKEDAKFLKSNMAIKKLKNATLFQPSALSALPVTLNLCYIEINNTGPPSSKIPHLQIPCFPI